MKKTATLIAAFCLAASFSISASDTGFMNGSTGLDISLAKHYTSGETNTDGGVMEIVSYCSGNGFAYAVNGKSGMLTAIDITTEGEELSGIDINIKEMVHDDGFEYGDMTSVAVSPDSKLLALALQDASYNKAGRIALFSILENGMIEPCDIFTAGIQPDMVTFSPDGEYVLTADEGEPREGYNAEDPEGSVTVVSLEDGISAVIGFEAFDNPLSMKKLEEKGVIMQKGQLPSSDFEPEYIAVCGSNAYITLQEANAVAILDLDNMVIKGI